MPGGVDDITPDLLGGVPKSAVTSFGDSPVPGMHSGSTDSPQMAVAYAPAKDSLVVVHASKPYGDHELLQISVFDVLEEVVEEA